MDERVRGVVGQFGRISIRKAENLQILSGDCRGRSERESEKCGEVESGRIRSHDLWLSQAVYVAGGRFWYLAMRARVTAVRIWLAADDAQMRMRIDRRSMKGTRQP